MSFAPILSLLVYFALLVCVAEAVCSIGTHWYGEGGGLEMQQKERERERVCVIEKERVCV